MPAGCEFRVGFAEPRDDRPLVVREEHQVREKPPTGHARRRQPQQHVPMIDEAIDPARRRERGRQPFRRSVCKVRQPTGPAGGGMLKPQQPEGIDHHRQRTEFVKHRSHNGT